MRVIIVLISIIWALELIAQSSYKVEFNLSSTEGAVFREHLPLFRYSEVTPVHIIFNKKIKANDTAFTKIITPCTSHFKRRDTLPVLVYNYKSKTPIIFIDNNKDFNFDEELGIVLFEKDSPSEVELFNLNSPNIKKVLVFFKDTIPTEEDKKMVFNFLGKPYLMNKDLSLLPVDYWLTYDYKSTRIGRIHIDGYTYKVGIYDGDYNGKFNDTIYDKIQIIDTVNQFKFTRARGAATFRTDPLLKINKKVYRLTEVDSLGSYAIISEENKQDYPYIEEGDTLPNFKLLTLNGDSIQLKTYLSRNKFTLLDIWGTWCRGCISQHTYLRSLYEIHKEELDIIGLVDDPNISKVEEYIKNNQITWQNFIVNDEVKKQFLQTGYPYYVLISPDRKIIKLNTSITESKKIIGR